jgi:phosphatidate cytidylyltransferase
MKELLTRSFFGLLYVLAVFFALMNYHSAFILLGLFLAIGLFEFSKLIKMPFKTILLPALFIFLSVYLTFHPEKIDEKVLKISYAFSLFTLFTPFIYFIFDKISVDILAKFYLGIFYLAIPFSIALSIDAKLLLAIFVIIWSSDSFAYLAGKNFGKHKLAEKISPKKTIEGLAGGMAGSIIVAFLLHKYTDFVTNLSLINFILLALIIVIFGTLGDLLESKFKRQAGVKDSGNIIPGHGGILDRLDSFILAVPFVYIFLKLI